MSALPYYFLSNALAVTPLATGSVLIVSLRVSYVPHSTFANSVDDPSQTQENSVRSINRRLV